MKRLLVAMLLNLPMTAKADHFEEVVGLRCDHLNNKLTVSHEGAYNDKGIQITTHLQPNQWDTRKLFDSDGAPKIISAACLLHHLQYKIQISGVTWNKDHSDTSAHILIIEGDSVLIDKDLDPSPFENRKNFRTIKQIIVQPKAKKPNIITVSEEEFQLPGSALDPTVPGYQYRGCLRKNSGCTRYPP